MARKQANPWVYALGGAVVGGLLLYWWRHRYPVAPAAFRPQLAVYTGGPVTALGTGVYEGQAATEDLPTAPIPNPLSAPVPAAPSPTPAAPTSPCGCKGSTQTTPRVVVDVWPTFQPTSPPQPPLPPPPPAPCPRLPGETLTSWQIRCGLLNRVTTYG